MADPPNTRNEDHPRRPKPRHLLSVVPRAAWHRLCRQTPFLRRVFDQLPNPFVGQRGNDRIHLREVKPGTGRRRDTLRLGANPLEHRLDLRRLEIPQLQTQHHLPRNHVVCSGERVNLADRAYLAPLTPGHNLIDALNELCSGEKSVFSLIHRRSSCVIRKALDCDIPLRDSDNSFNYADVRVLGLEQAALFDVQFEISRYVAAFPPHCAEMFWFAAEETDTFRDRFAAVSALRQLFFGELPCKRVAADCPSLFI